MGETEWETFDPAAVEWVDFELTDASAAVEMVRSLLRGEVGSSLVRIEGPEPPPRRSFLGRVKPVARLSAQVMAGRQGAPIVLTIGDETVEPVAARFARAGIELPEGWVFAAPDGTFPWVEAPATTEPRFVVAFVAGALTGLGSPTSGLWRAGIDTPRMVEHSHGAHGSHTHFFGQHHHHHH